MVCTLGAVYMNVQCMGDDDKRQPLLLADALAASSSAAAAKIGSINADTLEEQLPANACAAGASSSSGASGNVYTALLDDMEKGVSEKEAFIKMMRSIAPGLPQPNDFYTGSLYPASTVTNFQFWAAHNIPPEELYRSGVQLDEYVRNRQAAAQRLQERAEARARDERCVQTWSWVGGLAAAAGCITGLVYCIRWIDSCDNAYNSDCWDYGATRPPLQSYSQSYSHSQNYTYVTQVVTALVNKSKME